MSVDPHLNCFIDASILVYAFDRSAGIKHTIAAQQLRDCWETETGCLSIQVLQEFVVTCTRKIALPLTQQMARQIVADLAQWRVYSPEVNDLFHALDLQDLYPLSFWDALIVQSASRLGCKKLLSEDLNHGQVYSEVQVINPFK